MLRLLLGCILKIKFCSRLALGTLLIMWPTSLIQLVAGNRTWFTSYFLSLLWIDFVSFLRLLYLMILMIISYMEGIILEFSPSRVCMLFLASILKIFIIFIEIPSGSFRSPSELGILFEFFFTMESLSMFILTIFSCETIYVTSVRINLNLFFMPYRISL